MRAAIAPPRRAAAPSLRARSAYARVARQRRSSNGPPIRSAADVQGATRRVARASHGASSAPRPARNRLSRFGANWVIRPLRRIRARFIRGGLGANDVNFLAGAAGLLGGALRAAFGAGQRADALFTFDLDAADGQPREVHRLGRRAARRGPEVPRRAFRPLRRDGAQRGHLGRPPQARLPADAAREIRAAAEPRPRLRARLPRHRLRRDDFRPAHRRPHDLAPSIRSRARRCSRSAPARATSRPISRT